MKQDSLVLYKSRPARVIQLGKKLQIELADGETLSVRLKDVELLHPGPVADIAQLQARSLVAEAAGELETAWELLAGRATSLAELAELACGTFSPETAWASWQWVADGLYFQGTPSEVLARTPDQVAAERAHREARAAEERAWADFLQRLRTGQAHSEDSPFLREVEDLALARSDRCRVLQAMGRSESPMAAHALLLELGHWDHTADPYPHRLGLPTGPVTASLPLLPKEDRVDLTHLEAFAIDDEGNQEPDDALSLEDGRLWVHVADVAALVPPDSPADLEARGRGASLYLPEGTVQMLPESAIPTCGLGLDVISPALSFGLDLNLAGEVQGVEVVPSWVRVTRLTYEVAQERLDREPLQSMNRLAEQHLTRRYADGAVHIDLPEVRIWTGKDDVIIRPLRRLASRDLVTEAMLMAGTAVGRLAIEEGIPMPFSTQASPRMDERPVDVAGMFALRRSSSPSEYSLVPGLHTGLGLAMYVQATSPLRRYLDLVAHQQLRAYVLGGPLLSSQEVMERIGAAMAVTGSVKQAERLARQHWTLVYLAKRPDWEGEGVVVELRRPSGGPHRRGKRSSLGTVLIPELDLTVQVHLSHAVQLNSPIRLGKPVVNLPDLSVHMQLV